MSLSIFALLNGIPAIAIDFFGLIAGFHFLVRYLHTRKSLLPLCAVQFFSFFGLLLGQTLSFFYILLTQTNFDPISEGLIAYSSIPILLISSVYLGFDIFKPEWKIKALIIYVCSAVVFFIALWGFPTLMISYQIPQPGELPDFSLNSVALVIVVFYIFTALILLGGGFLRLRNRIEIEQRRKIGYLGIGYILFSIAAIIETAVSFEFVVIARILMFISIIIIFKGYSSSKEVQK